MEEKMKRKTSVKKTVKKKISARRGGLKFANLRKVRGGAWMAGDTKFWYDSAGNTIAQRPGEGPVLYSTAK
jgi:hypothetical protein